MPLPHMPQLNLNNSKKEGEESYIANTANKFKDFLELGEASEAMGQLGKTHLALHIIDSVGSILHFRRTNRFPSKRPIYRGC